MAEKITVDLPPSEELFANAAKDIELSISRLERMLDWLLLVRENVANLNLDFFSAFKPLETVHESNQPMQIDVKIVCPLHPDCEQVTNLVASNLNKILGQ